MRKKKYHQNYYKIRRPEKYKGNSSLVIYRSLWEKKTMEFFEDNSHIQWWNSEGLVIPYMALDKKIHRYYPDFIFLNSKNETWVVEVKPYKETIPPTTRQRNYQYAAVTFVQNQLKWKAAKEFCKKQNIKFVVWTEKELKKMHIM